MKDKNCIAGQTECTTVSACSYCNLIINLENIYQVLLEINEKGGVNELLKR